MHDAIRVLDFMKIINKSFKKKLTFVVKAISRIKTPADDFMLNFRFRLDRQLKSFIPSLIFSHFNSIYLKELFVVSPAFDLNHSVLELSFYSFYGSPHQNRFLPNLFFQNFIHAI